MIGDSASIASTKATLKAARFSFGSPRRAMTAAMNGPSQAIISHAAAIGSQ